MLSYSTTKQTLIWEYTPYIVSVTPPPPPKKKKKKIIKLYVHEILIKTLKTSLNIIEKKKLQENK